MMGSRRRPRRAVAAVHRRPGAGALQEIEREHIVRTLEQVRGNKRWRRGCSASAGGAFYRQLERHGLHHRVRRSARGSWSRAS